MRERKEEGRRRRKGGKINSHVYRGIQFPDRSGGGKHRRGLHFFHAIIAFIVPKEEAGIGMAYEKN